MGLFFPEGVLYQNPDKLIQELNGEMRERERKCVDIWVKNLKMTEQVEESTGLKEISLQGKSLWAEGKLLGEE